MKKIFYFILTIAIITVFIITKSIHAQIDEKNFFNTENNLNQLLDQGKAISCLGISEHFLDIDKKNKVMSNSTIHLKGECLSEKGCHCIFKWGKNINVGRNPDTDPEIIQVCEETKENKNKNKNINQCKRVISEINNPILKNLQPGEKTCNIITNNLNNQLIGENVLLPKGPIDILVKEQVYIHSPVEFFAIGDIPETTSEMGQGGVNVGDDSSQKLGSINFEETDFENTNIKTDCATILWDPFGRVFDAISLEPLPNIEVTLFDNLTKKPAEINYSYNSDITFIDGLFNILVEKEGYYFLNVNSLSKTHNFINKPSLSSFWNKIYSDLYFPKQIFYEKQGIPTHHDIPMQPINKPYKESIPQILPNTLRSRLIGNYLIFSGRQTFPFAKVCLIEENTNKQIGSCVKADNIGIFVFKINKNLVSSEKLLVKVEKLDLNDPKTYEKNLENNKISNNAITQSNKYYFEPIFSEIKGYAYDNNNNLIKNGLVKVFIKEDNRLFYQTKTDSNGYFSINKKNLPFFDYYLEFIDLKSNKKIKLSQLDFVKKQALINNKNNNNIFFKNNKINNFKETINNSLINPVKETVNKKNNSSTNQVLIIIIILIIILLFAGVIVIILFYKKNNQI